MMSIILPAMNATWFWFDKKDRRLLHGTPSDVMRKFDLISSYYDSLPGLEIFLFPSRLERLDQFSPSFYQNYSKLRYKSVHIGDPNQDFLCHAETFGEKLTLLSKILERLETDILILHAHHLQHNRQQIKELLVSTLPDVSICVENNGFDNEWGARIDNLVEIFSDCPEFEFCLDVAHVKDFDGQYGLSDFIENSVLLSRLKEVHFSYSTFHCPRDPYIARGYPGYGPYHALFSVLSKTPSQRTKEFVCQYPVILEGIVPREDKKLDFLKKEAELLIE